MSALPSISPALRYLYGLQRRGMKLGLRNMRYLLCSVGNPEQAFPSIHIAGTNGKGSTAAFLASIFMEASYKTALYTSPHLIRFTERIRINGTEMDEGRLVRYVRTLQPAVENVHATFFEATTCIAFMYFADENVDVAVVETGLGGRLDSTNVIKPLVSVITNVSYDHTEELGSTLVAIAREKGGIIKRRTPCVTSVHNDGALRVLSRTAAQRGSFLYHTDELVGLRSAARAGGSYRATFRTPHAVARNVTLGFPGCHQIANASTAVATIEVILRNNLLSRLNAKCIGTGLRNVRKNSRLHGRFETFGTHGRYLLDVAHNPDGVAKLVASLGREQKEQWVVVFGLMKDKDFRGMLDRLAPVTAEMITVRPGIPRALSTRVLCREARLRGIPATDGGSVGRGIALACRRSGMRILVTGSHYVVGEAMTYLGVS